MIHTVFTIVAYMFLVAIIYGVIYILTDSFFNDRVKIIIRDSENTKVEITNLQRELKAKDALLKAYETRLDTQMQILEDIKKADKKA